MKWDQQHPPGGEKRLKYPLDKPTRVLSLGAGVQSSAMLLAYDRGLLKDPPAFAVFADTQSEPKAVYDWLERLTKAVSIPVIVATKGSLVQDYLSEQQKFATIPFFVRNNDGTQGIGRRQCTREYKIDVIKKRPSGKSLGTSPGSG